MKTEKKPIDKLNSQAVNTDQIKGGSSRHKQVQTEEITPRPGGLPPIDKGPKKEVRS